MMKFSFKRCLLIRLEMKEHLVSYFKWMLRAMVFYMFNNHGQIVLNYCKGDFSIVK